MAKLKTFMRKRKAAFCTLLLVLLILCMTLGSAGLFERMVSVNAAESESRPAASTDTLKQMGFIQDENDKPSDYRQDSNPLNYTYSNLFCVPELNVYTGAVVNIKTQTVRQQFDNTGIFNKSSTLGFSPSTLIAATANSSLVPVKAVALNVQRNIILSQKFTAELTATNDTTWNVYFRNGNNASLQGLKYTIGVNDWSFMKDKQSNHLFDHYFQIVSGDFNGDGCDDIAFYEPDFKQTGATRAAKISIKFLKLNGTEIAELGSKQIALPDSPGFTVNDVRTTPTINLTVANLNKDKYSDLVITRGWVGTWYSPGSNDPASTLYIYDNLTSATMSSSFKSKLEYAGNLMGTFIFQNNETPKSTALIGAATAIGNIASQKSDSSNTGNEIVIGGYLTHKAGTTYADYSMNGALYMSGLRSYIPVISFIQYDYGTKQYNFGTEMQDGTSGTFTYQPITTKDGVYFDIKTSLYWHKDLPPVSIATAKFLGSEYNASIVINGIAVERNSNNVGKMIFYSNNSDTGFLLNSYNLSSGKNNWISQTVAANVRGDEYGTEQVFLVCNNGDSTVVNEVRMLKSPIAIIPYVPVKNSKSFANRDFGIGSYTSLCVQDIDANDGLSARFVARNFTYTNPRILGVLAAAPYFSELAATNSNYLDGSGTSVSITTGEAGEGRVSGSAYAGGGVKAEIGIIPGISAKAELEVVASASYEFSYGWDVSQTVTYTNTTPYDQVIATVLPVDIITYEVVRFNETGAEQSKSYMLIQSPYKQITKMMPVSEYDAIAAQTKGLVKIGGNILKSTAGDPSTYTGFVPPVPNDEPDNGIKHVEWDSGWGISSSSQSAWASATLEIAVSDTFSHAIDFELSVNFKAEIGVVVGGTVSAGASIGGGYTFVDYQGKTFAGTVPNLGNTSETPTRFDFDWQLCDFNVELDNGDNFPVVTFQTSGVKQPVLPPQNFKAEGSSITEIKLTWEHPKNAGTSVTGYEIQYRQKPNTSWTTLTSAVMPTATNYTHSSLSSSTVYEYRIRALVGTNEATHSVYTAVISSNTKVASPPTFSANVVDVSGNIGSPATFSVTVTRGRAGSQLDYQWQTYNKAKSAWENIADTNNSSYSTQAVTDSDIDSQFRCVVTETLNDISAQIISSTGKINVPKKNTTIALTFGATSGRALHDSSTLTATITGDTAAVSGLVTFTIIGPDYQTETYVSITNGAAVWKFTPPHEGVFTITAAYGGDAVYNASVSTPKTYTASAVVCVPLNISGVSSVFETVYNGSPQIGYGGMPEFYEQYKPTLSGVAYEVWYQSTDGNDYSSAIPPTDVGDYRITFHPSNEVLYSGELTLYFTIKPKLIWIIPNEGQSKIYGTADPIFTYTTTFFDEYGLYDDLLKSVVLEGAIGRIVGENVGKYEMGQATLFAGENYEVRLGAYVEFEIKKADYKNISSPAASTVYNKQLMLYDIQLPSGYIWTVQNRALTVADSGTAFNAKFNADPTNYNDFLLNITVTVEKAADGFLGQSLEVNKTYSPGLTLDGIKLVSDFVWISPWTALFAGDGQSFEAIYTDPSGNYLPDKITVKVNVAKAAGSFGAVAAISTVFSEGLKLADLILPAGYEWEQPDTLLTAGNNLLYGAVFTDQSGNYFPALGTVMVHIAKAQIDDTIASPTIASKTSGSITINAVTAPVGKTIEYSISPTFVAAATVWQTGLTFSELESGTAYCVSARVQGDANHLAGAAVFTLISTEEKTYVITEGGNSTWNGGTAESLQIVCDGDYSKFVGVKVNGVLIGKENYAVISDSSAVTLNSEYLQTLSYGKNTVEIVFANGSVATTMTVNGGTGLPDDNGNGTPGWAIALIVLCCVIILAMGGFAVYLFIFRKKENSKN